MKSIKFIVLAAIFYFIGSSVSWNGKPPAYDPIIRAVGQTVNATPANLYTYALGSGQTIRIEADVLGKSGNNRLMGRQAACIKNISGTLTIIGGSVADLIPTEADTGILAANFTITTSGTNVIIQAIGIAATTIDWIGLIKVYID